MKEQSNYEKEAQNFLARHGIEFRAVRKADKCPPWASGVSNAERLSGFATACAVCGATHGERYRVKLFKRAGRSAFYTETSRVTFDFWNSHVDAHEDHATTLRAYEVLSCLAVDICTPDTFSEYCSEYGCDEDSRRAEKLWKLSANLARKLRKFFPTEMERTELADIQ